MEYFRDVDFPIPKQFCSYISRVLRINQKFKTF